MPSLENSQYQVGSLVLLRGREWVVVPSDGDDVIRLRPLSGREEETIGVHRLLEENYLKPAKFPEPDPSSEAHHGIAEILRQLLTLQCLCFTFPVENERTRPSPLNKPVRMQPSLQMCPALALGLSASRIRARMRLHEVPFRAFAVDPTSAAKRFL